MGILERVLDRLKTAGFRADVAFPGQQFPTIRSTVAAVHLGKVTDTGVTLEVCIVGPGAAGGGSCETEALKATRALREMGAGCVQGPCRYDGVSQVYVVTIQAEFPGISGWESLTADPGLGVKLGTVKLGYPVKFTAEQKKTPVCGMGEKTPAGFVPGLWEITLEEEIPAGAAEESEPEEPFSTYLERNGIREIYMQCRWASLKREYSDRGIRKLRTGIAENRMLVM